MFRPALEKARDKNRQSNVGPKGYDVILLFKIFILQSLYNLSDDATEFQILDRHSLTWSRIRSRIEHIFGV
ncbi:MAG: transposase [Desulfobulbus sp.]|nr:transposase [Desulfobulbus sp.]